MRQRNQSGNLKHEDCWNSKINCKIEINVCHRRKYWRMSVPDENKHSDSQVRIHDTSSFETNCQRATQSNPTSDFSSLKSRQECPECQEPPEAPFDTCLLFYKNSRSPWNRCTVSRLEPFFSKVVHASIRHYSIFFVLESNLHDYGDFRRTTDRLVSRRRSPSPAKLPP